MRSWYGVEKAGPMGLPGVPSSSLEGMPLDGFRWSDGLRRYAPMPFGSVLGSWGDVGCTGGENGPGLVAKILAELARRALSFSARSARKKRSSGDSSRAMSETRGRCFGVGASESVGGGEGSWLARPVPLSPGESRALARKLGIGRDEGAGEAWKVAPAKAAPADFVAADCGGVVRPGFVGAGEVEPCF
jgi:hypothetical protein